MAAIYTGVHQQLKSPVTPWPEKLKLAQFAWESNQCLLPNKEQYLFDWVSRALSGHYNKKIEVPQDVVEKLWTYLNDILHSQNLCNVLSEGKTIVLSPALPQMINARILESSSRTVPAILSTVLSCCHGILSLPVLSVTYTAKYDLLVELVAGISDLACSQLSQQESLEPVSIEVFELLLNVLNTYLTVQRQQGNSKRVFTQVTKHLLQPICLLRHLLTSRSWTEKDDLKIRQNLSKDIRNKVDLILQSAFFFPDHLPSYKDELLSPEQESVCKKGSTGKGLFCPVAMILSELVQQQGADNGCLFYAARSTSLPFLCKLAFDSFCREAKNKIVCFHLMTKLITALGFTKDLNVQEAFNPVNWNLALLALENILNSCLAGDVYNVAADKIHHGEVQFKFFRKVAQLLFNNAQTGIPAWYRCLKILLSLNHHIVEPDLDELLSSVWVDADNTELHVKKAQEVLLCVVLQTYAKLRQLPTLIRELLIVICRPAADELRQPLLPEALQKALSQCILDNPPSHNLEICNLILEMMLNELPYVQEKRQESALKMFSMSVLLHAVLFGLKTVDDSTPLPTLKQTQSVMNDILKFLKALLQHLEGVSVTGGLCVEKVHEVGLLLTYSWHEADTAFHSHCSKYRTLCGQNSDDSPIFHTVNKVLALTRSGSQVISPLSRLLQKLLALHIMKAHLLRSPSLLSDADMQDLHETAQFVVNGQESLMNINPEQIWDRQLCSVSSDTYPVAFWFLITTNLPLIAPYLSKEVTSHIADTLLNSLLQSKTESNLEKSDLSAFLISKQLLTSTVLCELPELHSQVVGSITNKLFGLLSASDIQSYCPSSLKSCTEVDIDSAGKEEYIDTLSPSLRRLKAVAQEIMTCAKTGVSIPISKTRVDRVVKLVKIANVINPDAMSPEDYLGLFLNSFFMTLCVQCDGNEDISVFINLLKDLFSLMKRLFLGKNSHTLLKIVHGSVLLEAVMTSRFSSLDKGLFHNVSSTTWLSLLQSVQSFIQSLTHMILDRKSSVRINLEKFTSFMIESTATVRPSGEEATYSFQLYIVTLSTLCNEIMSVLGKSAQLDETLTHLLGKITSVMGPAIQTAFGGKIGSVNSQSYYIDVLTVMIKSELAKASHQTQDSDGKDGQHQLPHMELYKGFGEQILTDLYPSPQAMDFLISSFHYLSAFYLAAETTKEADLDSLHFKILRSVYNLLTGAWLTITAVKELEAPMRDLFNQLMVNCSLEQFRVLFLSMIRNGLVAAKVEAGHQRAILATVVLVKLLASCSQSKTSSELFWRVVPQVMSSLVSVIRESGKIPSLTSTLTVPAVETLTTLLRQGESHISDSHDVIAVLGALDFVPLESQSVEEYYSTFQAIHEALFAIILCYPKVMLKASAVFLNCFYRLVKSIIHEGRQKAENEKNKDFETLLKCAMLIERMYTHIGTTAEGFTVLNSFIVAQYVNELQRVTLQPQIKEHLSEGIYCILDHCVEQDIKFLNRTLSAGVQEVFKELYKNYTHYHKSQRQGEEKYTV